jgi:PIN domain nuclease of toxin-antitoxin system
MTLYITDAHALVWYLGGSPLLSEAARAAFDEAISGASELRVPAIVLAELIMLAEKRRRAIDVTAIVAALTTTPGFRLTPLSPQVVMRIQSLAFSDIHDRLIVAEALETGSTIITCDQAITDSGLVPTVW